MKKLFYGWYIVIATFLLNALGIGVFSNLLGIFFPAMKAAQGFTQAQVSSILVFASLGGLIASMVLGPIYQKKSTRKLILFLGIAQVITFLMLAVVSQLWVIYVVSVFMGFFTLGATALSAPILITRWFKSKRGVAMGISMAGAGVGPGLMTPLLSWIIYTGGYRQGLVVLTIIIAIGMAIAVLLIRDYPEDMNLKAYGDNEGDIQEVVKGSSTGKNYTLKEATKTPMFLPLIVVGFLSGFVASGALPQIPTYYEYLGASAKEAGLYLSAYAIAAGIFKVFTGWLYDKKGPIFSNFVFYGLMTLSFVALIFATNGKLFIYAYILFASLGMGVNAIVLPLFVSLLFGTAYYSMIYPVFMLLSTVGGMLGTYVFGWMIDHIGFNAMFVVAIVGSLIMLAGAQLSIIMKDKK